MTIELSSSEVEELREQFLAFIDASADPNMELVIHPFLIDYFWRMAEILKVDTSTLPTEAFFLDRLQKEKRGSHNGVD